MTDSSTTLQALIRDVPDFPKPGIMFKDITPLLADPSGLAMAVETMANPFRKSRVDLVIGAESRGFIFGTAIAQALSCGFVPIRKPGKLPLATHSVDYALEYGTDTLEMHADAITTGMRVLMVDADRDQLQLAASRFPTASVELFAADATDAEAVAAASARALDAFGRIDALVNVAGGAGPVRVISTSLRRACAQQ